MGFVGLAFTWSNGAVKEDPIFERLDRSMCTTDWLFMFQNNGALHLPGLSSDYAPILVNTNRVTKSKKIEYYWVDYPYFNYVVHKCWSAIQNNTINKISTLGKDLYKWSKEAFENIFRVIEDAKEKLIQFR